MPVSVSSPMPALVRNAGPPVPEESLITRFFGEYKTTHCRQTNEDTKAKVLCNIASSVRALNPEMAHDELLWLVSHTVFHVTGG